MSLTVISIARKARSKRLELLIEGRPGLSVTPEIAVRFSLRPGAQISEARLREIHDAQEYDDAMASALRLVSRRPRSEKELRDRISKRYPAPGLVDAIVSRLKELRLIDDAAFATSWVEVRDRSGPRSRRLLASELRLKGVPRETAAEVTAGIDEPDAAYRAAQRKARLLTGKPFDEFQRKVGDLLLRRGFGYETTSSTVRRLWEETGGGASTLVEDSV